MELRTQRRQQSNLGDENDPSDNSSFLPPNNRGIVSNPFKYALKHHKKTLLQFVFGGALQHGGYYLIFTFLPDYMSTSDMRDYEPFQNQPF